MTYDLRQPFAEALASKFTKPTYRSKKIAPGEWEDWVENPEPADRVEESVVVIYTAGDGHPAMRFPSCMEVAEVCAAIRDEEMEQLRYERRLLGAARMVLDLVAAGDSSRREQARREAEDLAQRIVDEIGHPVTDEPALGPGCRAEAAGWQARAERAEERLVLARNSLLLDGYFTSDEVGDDVAPRIVERLSELGHRAEKAEAVLACVLEYAEKLAALTTTPGTGTLDTVRADIGRHLIATIDIQSSSTREESR